MKEIIKKIENNIVAIKQACNESIQIIHNPRSANGTVIKFAPNTVKLLHKNFILINKLQICDSAEYSTKTFLAFHDFWNGMLYKGQYKFAITLWKYLLEITIKWERRNDKRNIHKGTPFGLLALTCLIARDIENAFSFLYNSVSADRKLSKSCKKFRYPYTAPSYLTATLSNSKDNFMGEYVKEIRAYINKFIKKYNKKYNKRFSIKKLDRVLLKNSNIEPLNYYFSFTIWSTFSYCKEIGKIYLKNDYTKLRCMDYLFKLCLLIDKLFFNHPVYGGGPYISSGIKNLIEAKYGVSKVNVEMIKEQENIHSRDPDDVIPIFFRPYYFNSVLLDEEVNFLFIAWIIRNFSAHNVKLQSIFAYEFDKLLEVLMFDIFLVLEEYP